MTIWELLSEATPDAASTFAALCILGVVVGTPVVLFFVWLSSLFGSRS